MSIGFRSRKNNDISPEEAILTDFYRFPSGKSWFKIYKGSNFVLFFCLFFAAISPVLFLKLGGKNGLTPNLFVFIGVYFLILIDQFLLAVLVLSDIMENFGHVKRQIFRLKRNELINWYEGDPNKKIARIPKHTWAWKAPQLLWHQIVFLLLLVVFTTLFLKSPPSFSPAILKTISYIWVFLMWLMFLCSTALMVFDILLLNLSLRKMFLEAINRFKEEARKRIMKLRYPVDVNDLLPSLGKTGRNPFVYFFNGTGEVWFFFFAPHSLCIYYGSSFNFRTGEYNFVHNLQEIGYEHITNVKAVEHKGDDCKGFCIKTASGTPVNLEVTSAAKIRAWLLSTKIRRKTKEMMLATKTPTYLEAEKYLLELLDFEKQQGFVRSLEGFRDFLNRLSNPERRLRRPITVVGTKGKGSTAAHLAAALASFGYKVGLYTSPHLIRMTERIRIVEKLRGGIVFREIPEDKFAFFVDYVKPYIHGQGMRTVFETLTAIAFLYFVDERVDFTVLEVGLGGRLDAVNVVEQKVTVVTPISYDHIHILGPEIDQIAREKLAVVKPSVRAKVIFAPQPKADESDVVSIARAVNEVLFEEKGLSRDAISILGTIEEDGRIVSELAEALGDVPIRGGYEVLEADERGTRFRFRYIPENQVVEETTRLIGRHQAMNAATALLTVYEMKLPQFKGTKPDISHVDSSRFPGRFHILREEEPRIVVDGAHNPASINRVVETVRELFSDRKVFLVFGVNRDKEYQRMLERLRELNIAKAIMTKADTPRAENPQRLKLVALKIGFYQYDLEAFDRSEDAFARAFALAEQFEEDARERGTNERALVLVTGSFYLVGEMMKWYYASLAP